MRELGGPETIGRNDLTPLVRRVLGRDAVAVEDWRRYAIHGGGGPATGGLYRFSGIATDGRQRVPWSLILKITRSPRGGERPWQWNYWKREVCAYRSGLLDHLPGGLVAPRCVAAAERGGEGAWLWLEELVDAGGVPWSLDRYGTAARHLGVFNGAYLGVASVRRYEWLSVSWLRTWTHDATPAIAQLPHILGHPLVRRLYPADSSSRVLRLWTQREPLLAALDRLPPTLCHLDAVQRNLFALQVADGRPSTGAADWASVGFGALGEELAPLIAGSVLLYGAELSALRELEDCVLAAYTDGLRDAGWRGDPRLVRLGYAAASALRYSLYGVVRQGILLDESRHAWAERALGHPLAEFIDRVVRVREHALALAEEACDRLHVLDSTAGAGSVP